MLCEPALEFGVAVGVVGHRAFLLSIASQAPEKPCGTGSCPRWSQARNDSTEPSFKREVKRAAGCAKALAYSNNLIQRVLDNSYGARFEQFGKQLADRVLTNHGLDRDPFLAFQVRTRIELRHRWRSDRRQQRDNPFEIFARDVHLDPDAPLRIQRSLE